MNDLAELYQNEGKYTQAEPIITKVLEIQRRTLGQKHPNTLKTMVALAALYRNQGKYAQAEPIYTGILNQATS